MAYRKRVFRRRTFRRRRVFRTTGRRTFTGLYRNMTSNIVGKFKLRQRLTGNFTSSAGGVLSQVVHVNDPSGCTDWNNLQTLYDLYRVTYCKVRFIPHYSQSTLGGVSPVQPVYWNYDPDSTTNAGTVDAMLQYDNCRVMRSTNRGFKYGVKPMPSTDNSVNNAGMSFTYRKGIGMMFDCANVTYMQRGIIGWYGDGAIINTDFGDLIVTYYVKFAVRR